MEAALFVGERTEYRVKLHEQGSVLVYGKRTEVFRDGQAVRLRIQPESVSVWPA